MSIRVHQYAVGGYDANFSYLLADETSRTAYVVDPAGDLTKLQETVAAQALTITGHLITHSHFDHVDALERALATYPAPVHAHAAAADRLTTPIEPLHDGDTLPLGRDAITVLHTPGHSPDAVCFFIAATAAADAVPHLISGDTLFVSKCGRTDRAHVEELYHSLQRLKQLPPETVIYPGHDYGDTPTATLAHELEHNPYLTAPDLTTFIQRRLGS